MLLLMRALHRFGVGSRSGEYCVAERGIRLEHIQVMLALLLLPVAVGGGDGSVSLVGVL